MKRVIYVLSCIMLLSAQALAQVQTTPDSLLREGTLQNCVRYAIAHQPSIQRSLLDEQITERIIGSKLADWYPQLNFGLTAQHYYRLPTSVASGSPVNTSLANASTGQFLLTQTIFNREVLLAHRTADDVREQSRYRTASNTIDVVTDVSKAFYAVLLAQDENAVLDEDIVRLEQNLKDAYNQYRSGVVDKTDYMRATVSLNNARAERKQNEELLKARSASLKELMGYPPDADLELEEDSSQMEKEIPIDTMQALDFDNRVEYKLLKTEKRLAEANLSYNTWSFLPSLQAFGDYTLNFQSSGLPDLYRRNYPSSFVGLQLSFPLFLGGKRIQEIEQAKLELERYDYDILAFKNSASTEYARALANYRSSLNTYAVLKGNLELARDVYRIIQLQYRAGTKTYLEVLSAETDLRTAQLDHTNALYQVLSDKLDVQKALGIITY